MAPSLAAQQGVEPYRQQLVSSERGAALAAYFECLGGAGQRCCQPVNADPFRVHNA
jgi:hypothetical protein